MPRTDFNISIILIDCLYDILLLNYNHKDINYNYTKRSFYNKKGRNTDI